MDSKSVKFLFGVHLHQPVDNFKEAVDEAVNKCYRPFFEVVKEFEFFKFSLHCSGWLFEKLKRDYKDVFNNIKFLNDRGNIEFFTAGFYEPVLSSISSKYRVSQIKKLNKFIKKNFSQTPKGLWLTERVWDDAIIADIKSGGIEYVMVDDYHFIASGFDKEGLDGYFYTENGGEKLSLFPINQELRYAIPFEEPKNAIEKIKEEKECAILFDDGEKFGLWPKTFEWVYEKEWLKEFLSLLKDDKEIESIHFSDFHKKNRAKGLAYLQNVSYEEMGEWSLKSNDAIKLEEIKEKIDLKDKEKFIKGGIWKNFFIKYDESNRLHKRMLELSKYKSKDKRYLDTLCKLQTNDVFWHGVFGGLYLPNLRDNAYRYLSECENIRYKDKNYSELVDTNLDGFLEAKIVSKDLIVRFDAKNGAQMIELIVRDKNFNFQNTLTRREEAYHKELLEEKRSEDTNEEVETIHNLKTTISDEVKDKIHFDWYIKNSFVDHITNSSFTLENFKKCSFWEYGDFANQPFEVSLNGNELNSFREGGIYYDQKFKTTIKKRYRVEDKRIGFELSLNSESPQDYIYALEFNLHFANAKNVLLNDKISLDNEIELEDIKSFSLRDGYTKKRLNFSLEKSFRLLATPIFSVSKSEKGYDSILQGISFAFILPFKKELELKGYMEIEDE